MHDCHRDVRTVRREQSVRKRGGGGGQRGGVSSGERERRGGMWETQVWVRGGAAAAGKGGCWRWSRRKNMSERLGKDE